MINKLILTILSLVLYFLSVGLVPLYRRFAQKKGILDIAGNRSSHEGATPRGGGVVFVVLWFITTLLGGVFGLFSSAELLSFLPMSLAAACLGFWDDYKGLSAKLRLLGQTLIAVLFVLTLGGIQEFHLFTATPTHLSLFAWMFAILGIIWSINSFNFMDGIDGLASIEATFVLAVGAFIFWLAGVPSLALLAWSMVVFVLGFLVWNWPKADIFMGDVGSYCLGFLIGAFAIVGDVWYNIPITIWIILYTFFWFDATITLLRRLYYKKHWATPHRDHAYQRLYQAGFAPSLILYMIIGLNLLFSGLALLGYFYQNYLWLLFLSALFIMILFYFFVEKKLPQEKN